MTVDYHSLPGVGGTSLADALRSPAHYYATHIARTAPRVETPAMRLGTAVHVATLEPEKWASQYVVAPECDRRTKVGKATAAAFELESIGKRVISASDAALAESIRDAVRAHPAAAGLIAKASGFEVPLAWTDEESGVACKGKVDMVCRVAGSTILCDLKTTQNASVRDFARSIATWSLHAQAAHYMAGWRAITGEVPAAYVLIAVESTAPHVVATYALDEDTLAAGAEKRARALEIIARGHETGMWPGYSDQIETISLPSWAA